MDAKELMINNIVGRKYTNPNPKGSTIGIEPCLIKSIKEESVNITASLKHKVIFSKIKYTSIEPIELTEEWLIKFGFRKDRNGYRLDDINSLSFSENFVVCWHDKVLGIKQIKYVHQLQNLYFCLTGEELKLN